MVDRQELRSNLLELNFPSWMNTGGAGEVGEYAPGNKGGGGKDVAGGSTGVRGDKSKHISRTCGIM